MLVFDSLFAFYDSHFWILLIRIWRNIM